MVTIQAKVIHIPTTSMTIPVSLAEVDQETRNIPEVQFADRPTMESNTP